MESTKTSKEAKDSMSDAEPDGPEDLDGPEQSERVERPRTVVADSGGFFHIYKKGQGYWTRMGTVAAAGLLGLLTGNFIYTESSRFLQTASLSKFMDSIHLQDPRGAYLLVALFALAYSAFAFSIMNKPANADFLIATDSEMKKVNWTTRRELMGSTRIVIGFMFVIAMLLFFYDLFFQMLFYLLGVLKTPPFFLGH
jgi:preprotein translocase subunit SecE